MPNVLSYSDKNYQRKKAIYDVLAQSLQDIKYGTSHSVLSAGNSLHAGTGWNQSVNEVQGVTLRFLGEEHISLCYHHIETATVEQLARMNLTEDGQRFLKEVEKELKKKFKKYTGKTLKLKQVKKDQSVERYGRVTAETSWMLGSNRNGYGNRPVGRYVVVDSSVYEFSTDL